MNINKIVKHKLFQTSSWYTLTNLFVKGINFITIPIFTRLLTTSDYGQVSLYLTWVGLFTVFISLDLAWSVQRAKFDFNDKYNQYISSISVLSILILTVYLLLFMLFEDFFIKLTGLSKGIFYYMIAQSYFTFIQNMALSKFQVEYKYKTVSIINICTSILGVLLSIFLIKYVFVGNEYIGRIMGSGSLIIVLGIFYLVYFIKNGKEVFNIEYWKYGLMISIPYILHNVSGVINAQFDRIIINRYVGASAAGLYSFSYNIGMIVSVLFMSFYQAYGPYFLEKMKNNEMNLISEIGNKFRDVFTVIYTIILFISPEIIKFMAQESYWEGISIIPYIFLAYYFNFMYSFEVYTEYYYKESKYISLGTFISAIINIILNLILIPKYGYYAAAVTTSISFFAQVIFHYLITKHVLRIDIYGFKFHALSLLYVSIITFYFIIFQQNPLLRAVGVLAVILIGYKIIFTKEIN